MSKALKKPDFVVGLDMLGNKVAEALGLEIRYMVPFRREYHEDGAPAPRVNMNYGHRYEDFEGKDVITVYRRRQLPTRDTVARHLTNYPRVVKNLKDPESFNVADVDVFYPYYIDGRADHNPRTDPDDVVRLRDQGRGIEYKADAAFFKVAGARRLLSFHPHFHREPGVIEVEGLEIVCLDAVPSMVRYARETLGITGDCLVVSPDLKPEREGKYDLALNFAMCAELDDAHLRKKRVTSEESSTTTQIDAKGRDVLIVDDIYSGGGTVWGAVKNINNPSRIDVMVVHGVFTKNGHNRANEMIANDDLPVRTITATHTIDSDFSKIPIHSEIAEFYNGSSKYPVREVS